MTTSNNNNRSWLSSSSVGSRDHEDDESTEEPHNTSNGNNTSQNSGRSSSRSGRYNHYKGKAPGKVRPWMRDKAVTGSTGSSRFGGSGLKVRPQLVLAEATGGSVGGSTTNSCANSVSSTSSFPTSDHAAMPLPREVQPTTPISSRSLLSTTDINMTMTSQQQGEEDISLLTMNKEDTSMSMMTTSVVYEGEPAEVRQEEEESYFEAVEEEQQEQQEKIPDNTDMPTTQQPEENDTVRTDVSSTAEEEPVEKFHDANIIIMEENTPVEKAEETVEEEILQEAATKEEDKSPEPTTITDDTTPVEESSNKLTTDTPLEEPTETTAISETSMEEEPAQEESTETEDKPEIALESTTEPESQPETSNKLDESIDEEAEEKSEKDEVYDELPSVQPSSYNPMAFRGSKTSSDQTPVSVAAYATMEKPTPLAKEQAALLNDAIHEGDEEPSFDEDDVATNALNMTGDSLQGINALDTTHEESVLEEAEAEEEENDDLNVSTEDDEFFKMWPKSVDPAELPEMDLPVDWNEQQMLAVAATQTWIRSQQLESQQRQAQSNNNKGHDDVKFTYSSYFAAALSDCPALTTAFYANSTHEDEGKQCYSYCPCSAQMGVWRTHRLSGKEENVLFGETIKCANQQFTSLELLEHCLETMQNSGDAQSCFLHAVVHKYLASLFGETHDAFSVEVKVDKEPEEVKVEKEPEEAPREPDTVAVSKEFMEEMDQVRGEIVRLKESNKDLFERLREAEDNEQIFKSKSIAATTSSDQQTREIKTLKETSQTLESKNTELMDKLQTAEKQAKEYEEKHTAAAKTVEEQGVKLTQSEEEIKKLSEVNASLVEKLQTEESKNVDAVASSAAQAEMMNGLCEELKKLDETNAELKRKLEAAEKLTATQKENIASSLAARNDSIERNLKLEAEKKQLEQTNATISKKLKAAEDRERKDEDIPLVHVGDMPVDLRRFRVQCQKYFTRLRLVQLKSHCVKDKSPAKFVVSYKDRTTLDFQALLDKGAAIESQDATYMFRPLDTFNKGHFHTHKLLLPWKITAGDGSTVSRSEFFSQVWKQLGDLKVVVGDKKTEIPLFQDSLGNLIPMPNAVLEGMLRVTPAELERIFAAKIAPYYRAIGRLMIQCVGATSDDDENYQQQISSAALPLILRQKLFRGVDPTDESYPLEQLLDHAFSLLGMEGMTRDKAFEYFSLEAKDFDDTASAVKKVREEVHAMWIEERSLALKALEEGLTLNGLADMSFVCGLVPLEAVNEIIFTQ